jgi:MGT family glycosyltransferase
MRFLFVVPPLLGHVIPVRALAGALDQRGHLVAWCGAEPETSRLVGLGSVFPAGSSGPFSVELRPAGLRGFAALKFLWENYQIPLAEKMLPGVLAAVERCEPDVIVADQQALAGPLAAQLTATSWVTSASTPAGLADPAAGMPKITEWIRGRQDELCVRHGVVPSDLRFSPDLVLAFTIPELAAHAVASAVRYVGAPRARSRSVEFPWAELDDRPLVVVTLGTSNAPTGRRFLHRALHALAELDDVQGVVVDPAGELDSPDVLLRTDVPLPLLLRRAAVMVCHGGHNTVCESLGAGVPLVVAPIRDDQTVLASRVADNGAGLRIRFDRCTADDIRHAITSVLAEPSYRTQAARLQRSLHATDGAQAAADLLETLTTEPKKGDTCNRT